MVDVEALRELVEQERERFGVPGVGLAVVADGEVVLCEGFGTRDIEAGDAVTAETHFPIASDTKAFTAALLCQLADRGVLDLDQPVRELVPWFEMHDPHATALVSVRDLLSHRTGLPRHDFVWYGDPDLTNEAAARALKHLEPNKQLRQVWQYNNLCYMTAGYVTEVLAGKPWAEVLQEQIVEPLGMAATATSPLGSAVKDLAQPYKDVDGTPQLQQIPEKNEVGPAGGIVATAADMSLWLQARLGGRTDVLSEDALAQLHGPAMIGGVGMATFEERQPMGYALGCQVESYRGRRIVRHGGNLVGYSSDVSIIPGSGVGVVIMTNLHGTALRDALPLMIMDRVLGLEPVPWGERYHAAMTALQQGRTEALAHHTASGARRPSARDLDEYTGTYDHPAYGALEVLRDGERLVPRLHALGDMIRLDHRDHDAFDLFLVEFDSALPLTFTQDGNGAIDGLTVALEPLVAPIRFTRRAPEADPQLVAALVGSYALGPHTLVVRTRGEELVAVVPTAGTLVLRSAGGNRFTAPAMPVVTVEAQLDEDGNVTSLLVDPIGVFTRQAS